MAVGPQQRGIADRGLDVSLVYSYIFLGAQVSIWRLYHWRQKRISHCVLRFQIFRVRCPDESVHHDFVVLDGGTGPWYLLVEQADSFFFRYGKLCPYACPCHMLPELRGPRLL